MWNPKKVTRARQSTRTGKRKLLPGPVTRALAGTLRKRLPGRFHQTHAQDPVSRRALCRREPQDALEVRIVDRRIEMAHDKTQKCRLFCRNGAELRHPGPVIHQQSNDDFGVST